MKLRPLGVSRIFVFLFVLVMPIPAQSPITFQYIYDDLNRLTKVIDSTGVMIQYVYDPVGNMTQVIRSNVIPGALTIFNITPMTAAVGSTLTIQGQGFSTTPSANTVTLNGIALTVVSATSTTLVVQVPTNATAGAISITVGGVTVASPGQESILPLPNILTLSPKATLGGAPFTLTVTGTNLNGSTFAFSPLLPISSAAINPAGTAATITVSPPSAALGYYTLVATNSVGPSNPVPQTGFLAGAAAFNTISIPGSNPNGDPDSDGLTNAQELMLGTDPLNGDTDGDHYLDGMEALFGSDPLNPLSIPVIPASAPYLTGRVVSMLNQVSPAAFSAQSYAVSGLNVSMLNSISPATAAQQTYQINGLPFSILNSITPATFSPQTYQVSGLSFSTLNSISPAAGAVQTYSLSGLRFSMLNAISPASASLQTYAISGLRFSVFNGANPPSNSMAAAPDRSIDGPSLHFLIPVDPTFLSGAFARGARRINGKPVCKDTDGDGLCDDDERIIGTNPYLADTDGDGYPDGLELLLGSDPLDPKSVPDIRPPGYLVTPPVSIKNIIPVARLTPRRQGAIHANKMR